ncbi:helix-turn-helix transcriptional regulator [Kitasatospora camelliae]|uniref:WYL domain-containing protein n=1 Tax=Kitasatospora camelliae TaxID=3156397 RepID=A0AAU8K2D7_9ACTN
MNRTDRLYAITEELRAASPRPLSVRTLARRFEVSTRTVERDLVALQESGLPLHARPGRRGGYVLDRTRTLPPLAITPAEAVALAAGLRALAGSPFAEAARSALQKVRAVMPAAQRAAADETASRVRLVVAGAHPAADTGTATGPGSVPRAVQEALAERRVLALHYRDRNGGLTERQVEPLGFLGERHWYLIGWCRLRSAVRGFRLDRIREVRALDERAPDRGVDLAELDALGRELVGLDATGVTA